MLKLFPLRFLATALVFTTASSAPAQDFPPEEPLNLFAPILPTPRTGSPINPAPDQLAVPFPYAPSGSGTEGVQPTGQQLLLEARLVEGQETLKHGVTWRVFGSTPGPDGHLPLMATASGGTGTVQLAPGTYLIHAAFGQAEATKRVTLGAGSRSESLVLDAGGLKLDAVVGEDQPLPAEKVSFEISQEPETGRRVVILPNATPRLILGLKAGTYHVISRYGTVNSVVTADIEVEAGKLTEAVLQHDGAETTLKLVSEAGGEALANTSWTVLTEAGDTVHESVGAFPQIILGAGKYTAVASHKGQVYSHDFEVESGRDRYVEVSLAELVPQANAGLD